jgi:Iron-sulfur cluster assembly protein
LSRRAEPGAFQPGAPRTKRSPGQGRLRAATTGPAGQPIASWSSRQLGRFAGAIGSRAAAAGSSSRRTHLACAVNAAWNALTYVYDPELRLDVVSLGPVYDVRGEDSAIVVEMTPPLSDDGQGIGPVTGGAAVILGLAIKPIRNRGDDPCFPLIRSRGTPGGPARVLASLVGRIQADMAGTVPRVVRSSCQRLASL